jgi:PmbA protein
MEGYYVVDGKIIHPINEMNISGNMNQFWFSLVELGNDSMENNSLKIPSLRFGNMDLSGV